MNTPGENENSTERTLKIHIVDLISRKEGGCTLVVRAPVNTDEWLKKHWADVLPGDFQGSMKVGRVWHLYYGIDPKFVPDSSVDIHLPQPH